MRENFPLIRFGDVAREVREAEQNPLDNGLECLIGLEHIEPENLHIKEWGSVADGTSFTRVFRKGQVLFGKRRAYQRKVALAEFDGICSSDIIVIEAIKDKLVPELLPFIFQSEGFFEHALSTSAGSLSPRTKWKHLAEYKFPLPPKDEQRRIAEILWAADEAVEKYEQLLQLLYVYRTKTIDAEINTDNVNYIRLEELTVRKPEYGINAAGIPYVQGAPRYVRITDINDEGFLSDEEIVGVEENSYENYILEDGDFLFSRTGSVGRTYLYQSIDGFCVFAGYLIRFRFDKSRINPLYFFYYTKSSNYKKWVLSTTRVGVQPNINATEYSNMSIPLPSLDRQDNIVSHLLEIDKKIEMTRKHKDNLIRLQTALREKYI